MSEIIEHEKKKRLRGMGAALEKQLKALETNDTFIEKFGKLSLKILLNATDDKYATLVEFKNGKVNVESISNENKNDLKKKVLGWDGMMVTTTPIFLKIATGDINDKEFKKLVVGRKIKVKGAKELRIYGDITDLLK
ncbi:MAG: hypothetical protein ACFFBP_08270 [Promethearchaeota archaeon]